MRVYEDVVHKRIHWVESYGKNLSLSHDEYTRKDI